MGAGVSGSDDPSPSNGWKSRGHGPIFLRMSFPPRPVVVSRLSPAWRRLMVASLSCTLLAACSETKSGGTPVDPAANTGCDRACLDGMVNQHLDVLVAHDLTKIPTTPDVRFVQTAWRCRSARRCGKRPVGAVPTRTTLPTSPRTGRLHRPMREPARV